MSIDTSKLVVPAILENLLRDKSGVPLANGVVTFYQDSDHTTLKNVYQQTGVYGNYSYVAVDNPLTLSAAGTTVDVDGNDILLYFYPYDETNSNIPQAYFITVYNSQGTFQFSRSNFPFTSSGGVSPTTTVPDFQQYIINNRFWRNIGSLTQSQINSMTQYTQMQYNNTGNYYYVTLAPDQHDGFSMPDFNYIKNVLGNSGTDNETITFNPFAETSSPTVLTGDIAPQYYLTYNCTADSSGAGLKVFQFPISYQVATLAAQPATFTIQTLLTSGNPLIQIYIYMFLGTGATSPAPKLIGSVTATTSWTKKEIAFSFPDTTGQAISPTGDSAYYLQIAMPTGETAAVTNINFTLPSIYLSPQNELPTNSFRTYDQIDSVINTPRTGDIRTSINSFYYYGWVPLNNGVIAQSNPNMLSGYTRANVDTWPLFNLMWQEFASYTVSTTNPIAQMYNSSGTPIAYGSTAYADWIANNSIALTQTMGKVLLGTVTPTALISPYVQEVSALTTYNSELQFTITTTASTVIFVGQPVNFVVNGTIPSGISQNAIYYVTNINANSTTNTFQIASTFQLALAGTATGGTNLGSYTHLYAYFQLTGTSEGEYAHTQLAAEVGPHTHNSSGSGFITDGVTGNAATAAGSQWGGQPSTATNSPSGVAFNVTQPGVFMNLFMKL